MKKLKLWGFLVLAFGAILLLPDKVLAEANFDELLTDGKFVIHSVKPTDETMAYNIIYESKLAKEYPNYYLNWGNICNEDYTKCTIYYGNYHPESDPSREVEMLYVYDNDIKTVADAMVSKLPEDKTKFQLTDLEYLNYLLYNYKNYRSTSGYNLGDFSDQLKKIINYNNFDIVIEQRAGEDTLFSMRQVGIASLRHNDSIYYVESMLGVTAKNVFYVDDDVQDVKKAVEDRITKAFGKANIQVSKSEKRAGELLGDEYDYFKNIIDNFASAEDYANAKTNEGEDRTKFIDEYNLAESVVRTTKSEYVDEMMNKNPFLTGPNAGLYIFRINDTVNIPFLVIKDSSKVNDNLNHSTNDVKTNISISTSDSLLPLDAAIKAEKLTSGAEYEKVIKTLDVKNHETFDLTLYSNSMSKNIETGKFEVKMPISDALKDKQLMVYYVDENNKVEEHEVTVKDGYATFTTDHFSIYTLAEKTSSTTDNPATSDDVFVYVGMLFVSALGVAGLSCVYLKNKKKIRKS